MSLSMLPLLQIKEIVWYLPFHISVYVVNLWVKHMAKLRNKSSSCTENIVLICCSSDTTKIKIWCLHWNVITHSVHKWTCCVFVFCVTEGFHCSDHGMNTRQENKLHIPSVRLFSVHLVSTVHLLKYLTSYNKIYSNIVTTYKPFKTLLRDCLVKNAFYSSQEFCLLVIMM